MNYWTKCALTMLIVGLLVIAGAGAWWYEYNWSRYVGALGQSESRIERLDGLVKADADVTKKLTVAKDVVKKLSHAAGESASNDLQQQLRQTISAQGCNLVSSQGSIEVSKTEQFDKARLTATVTCEWSKLVLLTAALETKQPPFLLQSASLFRDGGGGVGVLQNARMTLQLVAPLQRAGAGAK